MNRIHQIDPTQSTGKTKELFDAVKAKYGRIPNAVRVFANSTAGLEGYLGFSGALAHGVLPARLREQIALAVSEINGCSYCLSSHTLTGRKAGLSSEDVYGARRSTASDDKSDAALKLARSITLQRGQILDADLQAARSAGLNDEEIVEIVFNVALSTLTNYLNNVGEPVLDLPEVKPGHFGAEASVAVAS